MKAEHILTAHPEPDYHGGREYDGERFRRLALYFARAGVCPRLAPAREYESMDESA